MLGDGPDGRLESTALRFEGLSVVATRAYFGRSNDAKKARFISEKIVEMMQVRT